MKSSKLIPRSPVCSVRADTPIGQCIGLLRDKAMGAVVVLSDNNKDQIVGIFTERDLVKNMELIRRGNFWDTPVRTVMTASVRTISVEEIHRAPELMAKYGIRHLPVTAVERGRKRLVGVISMRDIFRIVMEELNYDLSKVFSPRAVEPSTPKNLVGVFSVDPAILKIVDRASRLTPRALVKSAVFRGGLDNLADYFESFSALFIDIDGMNPVELTKLFLQSRSTTKRKLFIAFSPTQLQESVRARLHKLAEGGHVSLLSKPIALGLLYEKFLKEL